MLARLNLLLHAKALYAKNELAEAAGVYTSLLVMDKDDAEAGVQLAHIFRERGDLKRAESLFNRFASESGPHQVSAQAGLALTLFQCEKFKEAWAAFDIRFSLMKDPPKVTVRRGSENLVLKQWQGLTKQKISSLLVMAEQGLGDTLQFSRYFPLLAKHNIHAIVVAPKRLHKMLRSIKGDFELKALEEKGSVATSHWLPMMGLPQALNLTAADYATPHKYMHAPNENKAKWQKHISHDKFNLCIVWQGNPDPSIDGGRSIPLEAYQPLLDIPEINLIALQQGFGEEQIENCSFRKRITRFSDMDKGDDGFVDSAAILELSDGLVSSCTSTPHLSGALNVPTSLFLKKYGTDWRWLAREKTSIWYPNHTLYRQETNGEWQGAIKAAVNDLAKKAKSKFALTELNAPSLIPSLDSENTFPAKSWLLLDNFCALKQQEALLENPNDLMEIIKARCALESEWNALVNSPKAEALKLRAENLTLQKAKNDKMLSESPRHSPHREAHLEKYWDISNELLTIKKQLLRLESI